VTTVKAEARRLILEEVRVPRGKLVTRRFTVNVRYKELGDGEVVRLKKDEQDEFDWDHRLTLLAACVMAAGEGRRLRPVTKRWPKPILPIDGRPVIATLMHELPAAGCRRVTVVTGYLAGQV